MTDASRFGMIVFCLRTVTLARNMNQNIKKTVWAAEDELRSPTDAAEYKHIFFDLLLKYISDAFVGRGQPLAAFIGEVQNEEVLA